jgi:hypothetical protein
VLTPPEQVFAPDHRIVCHLPRAQLLAMQPVFEVGGPNPNPSDKEASS